MGKPHITIQGSSNGALIIGGLTYQGIQFLGAPLLKHFKVMLVIVYNQVEVLHSMGSIFVFEEGNVESSSQDICILWFNE